MNALEFLGLVTPSQGFLILAEPLVIPGIKTNPMKHHVFSDLDALVEKAAQLNFEHKNVFFALAGFKQEKVWNPTAKNYKGEPGKWQTRTQANAGWLRSLFLDLDIDPNPDEKKAHTTFTSKPEAIAAMQAMVAKVGMPMPMVLDSGGGIHVYFPLDQDVPAEEWLPLAEKFKAICLTEKLRIDPAVPADTARVLRVLGCHNLKRDYARPVELISQGQGPVSVDRIDEAFAIYERQFGIVPLPKRSVARAAGADGVEGNLQPYYDPIDFGAVSFACAALGGQVAVRGKGATEPIWHFCLGLASFAIENKMEAALCISDAHEGFDRATMEQKMARWSAGPSKCISLHKEDPATCEECPHWGKITSPAQLGHEIVAAPQPTIEAPDVTTGLIVATPIPNPPFPYVRREGQVMMQVTDKFGNKDYDEVCPNDLYPTTIIRHTVNNEMTEKTIWRIHSARSEPADLDFPQGLIGDDRALQKFLYNSGVYVTPAQLKRTQSYMSAYLKHLASKQDRERMYDRLGWQGETHSSGIVIGQKLVKMDGSVARCNVNNHVNVATKNSLHPAGSFDAWKDNMKFYLGDRYRGHRFFLYIALGAPIFHMTSYKGVMVSAVGESGRGKTTCLNACGSIWGAPESLLINGNKQGTTVNALFDMIGTYHSLPVLLDEITDQDEDVVAEFALNITSGRGKERMKGNEHDGRVRTWETPVLTTANADKVAAIFAKRKDAQPHMMRVVSVDFDLVDRSPEAVNVADEFKRRLHTDCGHAGLKFAQFVAANYAAVQQKVIDTLASINLLLNAAPEERIWVATIAVAVTAGQIAEKLGLWDFPWREDFLWMQEHIRGVRDFHSDHVVTPMSTLADFLSTHINDMLVLAPKATTNLDNIALRPHKNLSIRHEADKQIMYIARSAMQEYLLKTRQNMRNIEKELVQTGVIIDRNSMKTLGADTAYPGGQVRCWKINTALIGTTLNPVIQAAMAAQNVVPIRFTGT